MTAALAVLGVDQATKWVAFALLPPQGLVITGFLSFITTWNRGVSFGLLAFDQAVWSLALVVLAVVVILFLIFWLSRAADWRQGAALGLVIGGAVGNVIDRLIYLKVRDFIDAHWEAFHWPTFNVADSAITVGAIWLVGLTLLKRSPRAN